MSDPESVQRIPAPETFEWADFRHEVGSFADRVVAHSELISYRDDLIAVEVGTNLLRKDLEEAGQRGSHVVEKAMGFMALYGLSVAENGYFSIDAEARKKNRPIAEEITAVSAASDEAYMDHIGVNLRLTGDTSNLPAGFLNQFKDLRPETDPLALELMLHRPAELPVEKQPTPLDTLRELGRRLYANPAYDMSPEELTFFYVDAPMLCAEYHDRPALRPRERRILPHTQEARADRDVELTRMYEHRKDYAEKDIQALEALMPEILMQQAQSARKGYEAVQSVYSAFRKEHTDDSSSYPSPSLDRQELHTSMIDDHDFMERLRAKMGQWKQEGVMGYLAEQAVRYGNRHTLVAWPNGYPDRDCLQALIKKTDELLEPDKGRSSLGFSNESLRESYREGAVRNLSALSAAALQPKLSKSKLLFSLMPSRQAEVEVPFNDYSYDRPWNLQDYRARGGAELLKRMHAVGTDPRIKREVPDLPEAVAYWHALHGQGFSFDEVNSRRLTKMLHRPMEGTLLPGKTSIMGVLTSDFTHHGADISFSGLMTHPYKLSLQ